MAKAGFWLKGAKGKLGGSTLQRGSTGGTVIRANAESVKNPKTVAQAFQRMVFGTVASAKSALKAIVDHSFEGIEYGQESLSYFQSINNNILRAAALRNDSRFNFDIKGAGVIVPNPYIISQGTLSLHNYWYEGTERIQGKEVCMAILSAEGILDEEVPDTATHYVEMLECMGLKPGDQLTMVATLKDPSLKVASCGDADNYASYVSIGRLVFKTVDEITDFGQPMFDGREVPNPNYFTRIEGDVRIYITDDEFFVQVPTFDKTVTGIALIRSQKGNDGKWKRSTSKLIPVNTTATARAADVYPSYMTAAADTNFESTRYLNNGLNENNAAQVEFPLSVQSITVGGKSLTAGATTIVPGTPLVSGVIDNMQDGQELYIGFIDENGDEGCVFTGDAFSNNGVINNSGLDNILSPGVEYTVYVCDQSGAIISGPFGKIKAMVELVITGLNDGGHITPGEVYISDESFFNVNAEIDSDAGDLVLCLMQGGNDVAYSWTQFDEGVLSGPRPGSGEGPLWQGFELLDGVTYDIVVWSLAVEDVVSQIPTPYKIRCEC